MVMWELLARRMPFEGVSFFKIPFEVVRGVRPPVPDPSYMPYGFADVMTDCW
jgi:hypothetical protein